MIPSNNNFRTGRVIPKIPSRPSVFFLFQRWKLEDALWKRFFTMSL